ncbi:hypothetical protein SteCoe_32375 [Stentor coeruleus]|uniref:Uncharacterized protein n=1 Tax=Stentor coeruleus TaxID=5963 RepID=A0A1R2AZ56_9CILI|nr:hypothetical protein SteCoe_32375 [Stentor coeruleus]
MGKFLCSIITKPRLQEFSISELISLSSLYNIPTQDLFSHYNFSFSTDQEYTDYFLKAIEHNPFIYTNIPSSDICKKIASRSICTERFTYHISHGDSIETLISNTINEYNSNLEIKDIISADTPFEFRFDTYLQKISQEQKQAIIQAFAPVPFRGKVELKSPERTFIVSICAGNMYFGLEVARSKIKRTCFYSKYNLAEREYLGPTTTDIELALLMVNQGQVVENSLVLDPFVGTGGILLAASVFGGVCYGGDIDMRVLKGLGVGRSTKNTQADIFTNFSNYGFKKPEILRCDNSTPCLRPINFFDCLICDPPYGVRAASRKTHKNTTEVYEGTKVFYDLLDFAAGMLRIGGRLVYLLPTERKLYDPLGLPKHPLLKIVANSENVLSRKISRRLITMERVGNAEGCDDENQKGFYQDIRTTWFRKEMR